jgi:hypothetical protein
VLEHPRDSKAFARYGLPEPVGRGWQPALVGASGIAWVCEVDQGWYGHLAQKPTWLFAVLPIGSGARRGNLESLSKRQRAATPLAFAEVLIALAKSAA